MTAELAVALPAVVLVLVVVLSAGSASVAHLRAVDAAAAGARAAALGEDDATVAATAGRVAGGGTSARVQRDGEWVEVEVRVPVVGTWAAAGPLVASAQAVARVEPSP